MQYYNFDKYNKVAEEPGGDYWKFLDATDDELSNADIYFFHFFDVVNCMSNEELKNKVREKLFSLIMTYGVIYRGIEWCLKLFTLEEIKMFLDNDFDKRIVNLLIDDNRLYYNASIVFEYFKLFEFIGDDEYEFSYIHKVLEQIKDYSDKRLLVSILNFFINRKNIYEKLVLEYYLYLPEEYKNYIRMSYDSSYLINKFLFLQKEKIDVGIDPSITIAPEIEANCKYSYSLDLSNQRGFSGEYKVKIDATVPEGNEIVPYRPFHNTPEEMAKFCALCEAMKDIGYYYDEERGNAAGQINLGLDYLDSKEAILNFYEIYGNCEELLYYISSEEGQIFRQSIYTSSRIKPLSEIIGKRIVDEELTREDVIRLFSADYDRNPGINGLLYKKNSVCLRGYDDRSYRFEFRIPNGGCNYRTWIDNIRLYGKMMERAKQIADMFKKEYLTEREEEILSLKIELQDRKLSLEDKLSILMDLLFEDDDIKQIYYDRYYATCKKIVETETTNYEREYYSYEPSFDEVEFMELYKSRLDPDYQGNGVVSYDPETDEIKIGKSK